MGPLDSTTSGQSFPAGVRIKRQEDISFLRRPRLYRVRRRSSKADAGQGRRALPGAERLNGEEWLKQRLIRRQSDLQCIKLQNVIDDLRRFTPQWTVQEAMTIASGVKSHRRIHLRGVAPGGSVFLKFFVC